MPVNKLNITLTPEEVDAINEAIQILKNSLPFGLNLTKEERLALSNIQDDRLSFVEKVVVDYAPVNANLVSGFAGTLANAVNDLTLYEQLRNVILQLQSVVETYTDTQQVAGNEAYEFSLEFYGTAQRAAKNNVPGTDAIVDDLGKLFEGQGPQPAPPTP